MRNPDFTQAAKFALEEDKAWQDVTSQGLPQPRAFARAVIHARQPGVLAGSLMAKVVFQVRDKRLQVALLSRDGTGIRPGQKIMTVRGSLQSLLSAERTALNFLSRLSGVATMPRRFREAVRGTGVGIYDTRKTTPGLRVLEKYAVRMGGGRNHRMDLASAVMLKDNHLEAIRLSGLRLKECVERWRREHSQYPVIEMEAQNLPQVWNAIEAKVDLVLLDNLDFVTLQKAMRLVKAARRARTSRRPQVEVSGGVTLSNVKAIADLKPDRISIGMMTHSAPGLNFNMDVVSR